MGSINGNKKIIDITIVIHQLETWQTPWINAQVVARYCRLPIFRAMYSRPVIQSEVLSSCCPDTEAMPCDPAVRSYWRMDNITMMYRSERCPVVRRIDNTTITY
jgi:hypothetical protein